MNQHSPENIAHFQQLYADDPDPWNVRQRWYEQRKRSLVLASLPKQHYRSIFEPGCGNAELTVALAHRGSQLLAVDGAAAAVLHARARLHAEPDTTHIRVEQRMIPASWPPDATFDLIVISEFAYYLNPAELDLLIKQTVASLEPQGDLLLCHWKAPFADRVQSTAHVHQCVNAAAGLHRLVSHDEPDFLLELWSKQTGSMPVSQRPEAI